MSFGSLIDIFANGSYYFSFTFKCWLFLISKSYRNSFHEKWKGQRSMTVVQDIIGLFLGFIISVTTVGFLLIYFVPKLRL